MDSACLLLLNGAQGRAAISISGPEEVCDLVFLSRYMRPEGPWQRLRRCLMQRRWLFLYTIIPCARTGLTGHSGPPTPPTVKKDKGKKKTPPHVRQEEKTKEKYILRAGLGPPPLRSRPPPCSLGAFSQYLCTPLSWCVKTLKRHPWPSPPTDTSPTGLSASSTSKPPRSLSIASSSAVAMPGAS